MVQISFCYIFLFVLNVKMHLFDNQPPFLMTNCSGKILLVMFYNKV